jgi:hypothetical protein
MQNAVPAQIAFAELDLEYCGFGIRSKCCNISSLKLFMSVDCERRNQPGRGAGRSSNIQVPYSGTANVAKGTATPSCTLAALLPHLSPKQYPLTTGGYDHFIYDYEQARLHSTVRESMRVEPREPRVTAKACTMFL